MDSQQFDNLVRQLAQATSRRRVLKAAVGGAAGAAIALFGQGPARTKAAKVGLCHVTGDPNNPFVYLEVGSNQAVADHLGHGDVLVSDNSPSACGTGCVDCTQSPPPNTVPTCAGGTCSFPCAGGYIDCGAGCVAGNCCTVDTCSPPTEPCQVATCASNACGFAPAAEGTFCRAPADVCHQAAVCDGINTACPANPPADGATCDDDNACTTNDACADGICIGTPAENGTGCGDGQICCAGDCVLDCDQGLLSCEAVCGDGCCIGKDACDDSEGFCCHEEQICGDEDDGTAFCCSDARSSGPQQVCFQGSCVSADQFCSTDTDCTETDGAFTCVGNVCCPFLRNCGDLCCEVGSNCDTPGHNGVCRTLTPIGVARHI